MKFPNRWLPFLFSGLVSCTDHADPHQGEAVPSPLYELALDPSIQAYIEQYTTQLKVQKTEAVVTVNWTGVYGGQCVYISQSRYHPKALERYPYFWARHRGYLVFVYDSKYPNRLTHQQLLQQEIERELRRSHITLLPRNESNYEPLTWRITQCENRVEIDTTNVYAKLKDCP